MRHESIISGLTHTEKLEARDLLWREMSHKPSKYAPPTWHERILADRLENPNPCEPLPLNEARSEVKERPDARRTQGWGSRRRG